MTTTIAICVQKGGTGKTTATLQLSDALARMKRRVLVIDLDPQSNASTVLSRVSPSLLANTTKELLLDPDTSVADCIQESQFEGVDIVCSNIKLARSEPELIRRNTTILAKRLRVLEGVYDYILLDCPPTLGRLTGNALCAADYYLIPIKGGDQFALDGLDDLNGFANEARMDNENLRMLGVFFNMFDGRPKVAQLIEAEAREQFGNHMFTQNIPQSAVFMNSVAARQSVFALDPYSQGAKKFKLLAREVVARVEGEHAAAFENEGE